MKRFDFNNMIIKECFKCNKYNDYLRKSKYIILCKSCKRIFKKGREITLK